MQPYPVNWVATGRAVVYYALAGCAFSAGIKCRLGTSGKFGSRRVEITGILESLLFDTMLIFYTQMPPEKEQCIRQLQLRTWGYNATIPSSTEDVFNMIYLMREWRTNKEEYPILFQCR